MAAKKHSRDFEKWKTRYDRGGCTKEQLARLVALHKKGSTSGITPEEYKEITGEPYEGE